MGENRFYIFLLPGLLSTYWLKDWSWVFLTVESLLNTTGFLNRSAAFCDRSARCSSVPFCWGKKNRHTTVPFVYKREDTNSKGTFLWGDRTQLFTKWISQPGPWFILDGSIGCRGKKVEEWLTFPLFFCFVEYVVATTVAFCFAGTLLQNSPLLYQAELFIVAGICHKCRF